MHPLELVYAKRSVFIPHNFRLFSSAPFRFGYWKKASQLTFIVEIYLFRHDNPSRLGLLEVWYIRPIFFELCTSTIAWAVYQVRMFSLPSFVQWQFFWLVGVKRWCIKKWSIEVEQDPLTWTSACACGVAQQRTAIFSGKSLISQSWSWDLEIPKAPSSRKIITLSVNSYVMGIFKSFSSKENYRS